MHGQFVVLRNPFHPRFYSWKLVRRGGFVVKKRLKIFENFVPQFPKKEVKGCFRQLNNKHYLGKSVSSVQTVVLCPRSQLVFIRGNLSAVADSWLRKKWDLKA